MRHAPAATPVSASCGSVPHGRDDHHRRCLERARRGLQAEEDAHVPRSQNSNFEASTALENPRAEIVDIEALAGAAEAAAEALPAPAIVRQRVVFDRIQSLATKTSEQVSAPLRFANA